MLENFDSRFPGSPETFPDPVGNSPNRTAIDAPHDRVLCGSLIFSRYYIILIQNAMPLQAFPASRQGWSLARYKAQMSEVTLKESEWRGRVIVLHWRKEERNRKFCFLTCSSIEIA